MDDNLDRDTAAQTVRSAVAGMSPGDRDVVTMALANDLDPLDTAVALGLSGSHMHARMSRARKALAKSARAHALFATPDCPELARTLAAVDLFNPLVCKRVTKHTRSCHHCERRSTAAMVWIGPAMAAPASVPAPVGLLNRLEHELQTGEAVPTPPSSGPGTSPVGGSTP